MRLAIDLLETHRGVGLKPRDAVHTATAFHHGISRVISTDKDFDHLDLITRIDPLTSLSSS